MYVTHSDPQAKSCPNLSNHTCPLVSLHHLYICIVILHLKTSSRFSKRSLDLDCADILEVHVVPGFWVAAVSNTASNWHNNVRDQQQIPLVLKILTSMASWPNQTSSVCVILVLIHQPVIKINILNIN